MRHCESGSRKLLLFDIDGTLIDSGGVGLGALQDGFFEAFPDAEKEFPKLDLAGATDGGIAIFLFSFFGIEDNRANRDRFFNAYLESLRRRFADAPAEAGGLLPGVEKLLSALSNDSEHILGLLTGNIADGARVKTDHFGLEGIFSFGAFGDDHHDRNELGPIALERAEAVSGECFGPDQVFVIGDTPKDIACARAAGFSVIAVATGACPRSELEAHSPDHIFDGLSPTNEVMASFV